ncbi:dTDP-3-amino-3, 6-dideoxy-alpha-D-galactopyranose transaminase [Burkholderia multivorans]
MTIEYENLANTNAALLSELEAAASRVIRSGWYILGQEVSAFEAEFAAYAGAKHCIGTGNGLDALVLSLEALALPPGSDVLVASNTYIATILAILRAGHRPVLVEPDVRTFNIDPARLAQALTPATRAICVTHLFGKTCRMDEIGAFAAEHGLRIVEDCAQSHGARLAGRMTGTFGDAGCFSFYPTKNIGALGDAGAVITDDDDLADRLRHLRNYGSKQKYVNKYIGVNSRLDEIQAAMLRVKLRYIDEMTAHKRQLADVYLGSLRGLVLPQTRDDEFDVFHIFAVRHPQRNALRQHLLERGIKTEIHYPIPPHRQEAMACTLTGDYPIADELHQTQLSLPISYGHTVRDVEQVCDAIASFKA